MFSKKYKIPILYEDENVLVIDKPASLQVHPASSKKGDETLVDWILKNYPEISGVGEDMIGSKGEKILRPGIVHRLDKETSGVLIIAKNNESFNFLKIGFQERRIKKIYKAIVYGCVKDDTGTIEGSIGRSRKDFRKRIVTSDKKGKTREAKTSFRVLERFKDTSLLEVVPYTGRTHQIRIHLKSIGHPVLCDKLYAPKRECPSLLGRLALHASELEFFLPNNMRIKVAAGTPKDFKKTVAELRSL